MVHFVDRLLCWPALVLIPALQLSRAEVQDDFKDAGRGGGQDLRRSWVRQALIVSEMGLACLLLVSAGLFTRSFSRFAKCGPSAFNRNKSPFGILSTICRSEIQHRKTRFTQK